MAHSLSPKSARRSQAPDLPSSLSEALDRARGNFTDLEAWEILDEACREFDRPDEAAALYTEALASKLSSEDLAEVGRSAADFCEEWYEETDPVLEMLSTVLEADASQTWAFERLTILLTVSAQWEALLLAYDTALDACTDESRKELLFAEAAKVARDFASRPIEASSYLKRLLLLRPKDEQLASSLEKRLDEQGRHQDLIDIWTARLSVLSAPQATKTRLLIAARHLNALNDAESAYLGIEEYLENGGSGDSACETVEKIADLSVAPEDVRRSALELLEKIHLEAGRSREVISVLERALVLAQGDEARIVLHRRSAQLLSEGGEKEEALRHCAEAFKLDSTLDDLRQQAFELAEASGAFSQYSEAIIDAAGLTSDAGLRVSLLNEAALLSRERLNDPDKAIELYIRAETDIEASSEQRLTACRQLTELLLDGEQKLELLSYLEKRAILESEPTDQASNLVQAALLATELSQEERALGLWSQRLVLDPQYLQALSAKVELLAEGSNYSALVEALVARADSGVDSEVQRADLVRAAGVLFDHMTDADDAIAMWTTIESRFGRVSESLDALVSLNQKAGNYEKVVSLLDEAIVQEEDQVRRVNHHSQLGDTQRVHLERLDDSLKSYCAALELDPRCDAAREGLSALILKPEQAHRAAESLAGAYRSASELSAIVELVETRLQAAPSDTFRSSVLMEAARILEEGAELPRALASVGRAFTLAPTEDIEAELQRLGELAADHESVSEFYASAIDNLADESRVFSLQVARGRLEDQLLQRASKASEAFLAALRIDASDPEVLRSLLRTALRAEAFGDAAWGLLEVSRRQGALLIGHVEYFAERAALTGNWPGVLEAFLNQIVVAEDLSAVLVHDLKLQLAVWNRDEAKDAEAAESVLAQAVQDFPREDSLRILAELQRRSPGTSLVTTLMTLSNLVGDELSILREAGTVALDPVGDSVLATPILEKSLLVASSRFSVPSEEGGESALEAEEVAAWATDCLVDLAISDKRVEDAVELLEASALLPFAESEQVVRRFRAAEVANQAGLDDRSAALCKSILEASRHHEGALTLLGDLHEKAGRLDDLLELRKRELALDRPQERRIFLRLEQSRVMGQTGAALEERIAILQENLLDLPGHAATIEALAAIQNAEESYEALAEMLETQAKAIAEREPERAARLWERVGRLVEEQFGDEERLSVNFKLSAAASPTIFVLDRLARLSEAAEDWESEVSWLQLRLSLSPAEGEEEEIRAERRRVVDRLAKALVASDEREAARDCLREELKSDPAADELRQALSVIYRELQEWEELSRLLAAGVEFVEEPEARISYLRRAAVVERRRLDNLDAAIPLLERAISLDESDRSLKLLLADTFRAATRFEPAVELLEKLLEEFGRRRTKERATVHTQLARIAQASGNIEEALEQAEAAAKIERTDPVILMLVGQLARERGQLERAEQAYQTLALIASRRTASSSDDDFEEVGESTILFELSRIAEEKGEAEQSRELLDSALEVATRRPEEAVRLSKELLATGQIELILNALQESLDTGLEGDLAARLLVTKADVLSQAEREDEAFVARKLALTQSPQDGLLIDATRKLAERCDLRREFWTHLVQLAESNAELPQVSGDLWYRAGVSAESEDGDLTRASELFELSQKSGFKPKRAFVSLDRVLKKDGSQLERLHAALLRFVGADGVESSPDLLGDALYRLAEYAFTARQLDEGAGYLLQALEVDTQEERGLAMLAPIVREGGAPDSIKMLLLRVSRNASDDVTRIFAYRVAAETEGVELNVLNEGIELSRRMEDSLVLRELMSRAIEVAHQRETIPAVRSLLVERAGLAKDDGDYAMESNLLGEAISCFEPDERFELELRRASCLAEHLGDIEAGQEVFERLLEAAPEESRIWRPLLALYRDAGRSDAVEALIAKLESQVTDLSDLEALKMERIRLMVRGDRVSEAEEELRTALSEHPQMVEAASILTEILRTAERWDELKELIEDLYRRAFDREDETLVARFGLELAKLIVEDDRAEAINLLNSGLSLAKKSKEYLSYLSSLYTDDDNQSEFCDVLEMLLALQVGLDARNLAFDLYNKRNSLGDEFGAGRALEIAVEMAPDQEELVQFYVDFLRASDEFEKLALALTLQAERLPQGEGRAEKYAEIARIFEENLSDPEKAESAISKAYESDPTNSAYIERSARYLVTLGKIDAALEKLKLVIDTGDEMVLADLLELRATIIRQDRAGDRAAMSQAAKDLELALEQLIPEEQEEALQVARVEVLSELRSLHQAANDEDAERTVVLELASLLKRRGSGSAGINTLSSWLREHESDTDVAAQLGATATEAGDHSTAVFAYEKMVNATEGTVKTNAVLLLADAAEASGSPLDARSSLEAAFAENPAEHRLRDRLRIMYEAGGEYEELARILMAEADRSEDPDVRSSLLVDVGDLYMKAEDGEAACSVYEQALEITGHPYLVTSKLAASYLLRGEVQRAEEILTEAVREHGKRRSPDLALLQGTLAKVAQAMGDDDGMFSWLEAALMSDRNNAVIASELALKAQEQGRYDIAIKALQSLTLSKTPGPIGKAEAYFRQAQIAEAQGDGKKALLMARRAHSTDGELDGVSELVKRLGA